MKNLAVLLIVLLFLSCQKDDQPTTLIVTNGINQSQYKTYRDASFMESVVILYIGADNKYVRSDEYPIAYSTVQSLSNYQVTSTVLDDNVVSIIVIVQFYYTSNSVIVINYESEDIPIHEGINTYTITESDLVD